MKQNESLENGVFDVYKIAIEEVLSNGYYPDIVKIYMQSLRIFLLKGIIEYQEGKRICEEIIVDYGGDFEHNFEIYKVVKLVFAGSVKKSHIFKVW